MKDPYKGKRDEIQDWMKNEVAENAVDECYDALSVAADACSFFGLFIPDPHGSKAIWIPPEVMEYALELLPE